MAEHNLNGRVIFNFLNVCIPPVSTNVMTALRVCLSYSTHSTSPPPFRDLQKLSSNLSLIWLSGNSSGISVTLTFILETSMWTWEIISYSEKGMRKVSTFNRNLKSFNHHITWNLTPGFNGTGLATTSRSTSFIRTWWFCILITFWATEK